MVKIPYFPLFLATGVAVLAGCDMPAFSAKRDFQKTIPVNSQVEVIAETFNGSLEVTPSETSEIELVAHIKAYGHTQEEADQYLEELQPEIETSTSAVTIRCKKRSSRFISSDSVSLELRVPAKWPLRLTTSNGAIKAAKSESAVIAETSNGRIEIFDSVGPLELSTSNGRIVIERAHGNVKAQTSNGAIKIVDCELEGDCRISTSNGTIDASLKQNSPVRFDASTSNGSVRCGESNFEITKQSKTRIEGVWLGKSDPASSGKSFLEIETSNGSITVGGSTVESPAQEPATESPNVEPTQVESQSLSST